MYTNDSPEASLPRFAEGLKRAESDFERALKNTDGLYTIGTYGEAVNVYGKYARRAVLEEGGAIDQDSSFGDDDNFIITFPAGTVIQEFNVPAGRNIENHIASDVVICLPSGKLLVFEQYGTGDYFWDASDATQEELFLRMRG